MNYNYKALKSRLFSRGRSIEPKTMKPKAVS